jgi:hypothetical protein
VPLYIVNIFSATLVLAFYLFHKPSIGGDRWRGVGSSGGAWLVLRVKVFLDVMNLASRFFE